MITLLLTTGARHPFKIDRKYLKRRSVKVENDDPFNMSDVYIEGIDMEGVAVWYVYKQ